MRRVYPVRTTRNRWKIPLFCKHKCDESCNILFLNDEEDDYVIVENPNYKNGKCLNNNTLEKTFINISNFNIDEPNGHFGPLYNSDVKVISDNSFKLLIYYPLSYVFEVIIQTPTLNGFTLKELIYSIKNLLDKENINTQGVAISLNRVFVPKNKISNVFLKNNDDIEIVTPYEGG